MEDLEIEIGEAAVKIWEILSSKGAMSRSGITKATGLSVLLVNQGTGWLAREGKLSTEKSKRTELIKLKE